MNIRFLPQHTLFCALLAIYALPASSAEITALVSGLKNDQGQVVLHLYNQPEPFPTQPDRSFQTTKAKIQRGQAKVSFKSIPPGLYAIAAYHDENHNNKLDTSFIGIPNEGMGASNEAKGHFGPPKFKDAQFTVESEDQQLSIQIKY